MYRIITEFVVAISFTISSLESEEDRILTVADSNAHGGPWIQKKKGTDQGRNKN
jgi:hypothetical protein